MYNIAQESLKTAGMKAEEKLSCNGVEMIREYLSPVLADEEKYVYDVYYTEGAEDNTVDFDDFMLDSLGMKCLTFFQRYRSFLIAVFVFSLPAAV